MRQSIVVAKSISLAKKTRIKKMLKSKEIQAEIAKREIRKKEQRDTKDRKKVERKLRSTKLPDLENEFPELPEQKIADLKLLLSGKSVGRDLHHVWADVDGSKTYHGRIEKVKNNLMFRVGYWDPETETHDDAVDFNLSAYQLGADIINDDLILF